MEIAGTCYSLNHSLTVIGFNGSLVECVPRLAYDLSHLFLNRSSGGEKGHVIGLTVGHSLSKTGKTRCE